MMRLRHLTGILAILAMLLSPPAFAHSLREEGEEVRVAKSSMRVTPETNWNRLNGRRGKQTERWTLDGPQLNDVTFFGGVQDGDTLFRSRGRNGPSLPEFASDMLIIDIPDLLDSTYRVIRGVRAFELRNLEPIQFLGRDGIKFEYQMTAGDGLTRLGEARAIIVGGELYMITYEAPRIHYFDRNLADFHALASSAVLN